MLNNRGLERGYKELLRYHHNIKGDCLRRRHTKNNKTYNCYSIDEFCLQGC